MVETIDKEHGRLEIRRIQTSTALDGYLNFPHVQQIFRITKTVTILKTQETSTEIIYGITSLRPEAASADRLLQLHRGHWAIENKSHYVRDMAFDEDRCRIRTGKGPQTMAAIRNFAMSLLRLNGLTAITKSMREIAHRPHLAFALMGI